jgi:hypothetical protein
MITVSGTLPVLLAWSAHDGDIRGLFAASTITLRCCQLVVSVPLLLQGLEDVCHDLHLALGGETVMKELISVHDLHHHHHQKAPKFRPLLYRTAWLLFSSFLGRVCVETSY